jgi:DNA-binding NtrC family response regulator
MKEFNFHIKYDPTLMSYGRFHTKLDDMFEYEFVKFVLERHQGNLSRAAAEVKMDRKHLDLLAIKHKLRQRKSRKLVKPIECKI